MPITKPFPKPIPKEDFEECCEQEQFPLLQAEKVDVGNDLDNEIEFEISVDIFYVRKLKNLVKKIFRVPNLQNLFRI